MAETETLCPQTKTTFFVVSPLSVLADGVSSAASVARQFCGIWKAFSRQFGQMNSFRTESEIDSDSIGAVISHQLPDLANRPAEFCLFWNGALVRGEHAWSWGRTKVIRTGASFGQTITRDVCRICWLQIREPVAGKDLERSSLYGRIESTMPLITKRRPVKRPLRFL